MHYCFMNKPHGVTRTGTKINTVIHYQYIAREGQYVRIKGRTEDLVFTESGNMPEWANSAGDFWDAAESHRRTNGRAYREFILGLQEELSIEDNVACIHKLMEMTGIKDKHAYTFAVHDKVAHFDKDHRNIHCHLMFSELEIEKDRPLDETKYFSRYSKNEDGKLTGGYKADRYFHDRNSTVEMRHIWANIVNAKFKERGLECRIDERTLQAQKEEKIANGITEGLQYLSRTAPEHLGGAYRNKETTAKIELAIKYYKTNTDVVTDSDIENIKDPKILTFAYDFNLRQIAKQIQTERYNNLIDNNSIRENIENIDPEQPFAISVNNLCDELKIRSWQQQRLLENYQEQVKTIKNKIVFEKAIQATATDRLLNGKYKSVLVEYYKLAKAEKVLWDEYHEIKENFPRGSQELQEKLNQWHQKFDEPHHRKQELGNEIKKFKEIISQPEFTAKCNEEIEKIKAINEVELPKLQAINKQIFICEKKIERSEKALKELSQVDGNEILFRSKIPPLVSNQTRLYGTVKVSELPQCMVEEQKYFVFQKINENSSLAVKFNDLTLQGKAKVYEIKAVTNANNTKKYSVTPTGTNVALYKEKNRVPQAEYSRGFAKSGSSFVNQITSLANAAEEKGAMKMHAEAIKELPKDEVSKIEKEIYQNWEKGMRWQR